MLQKARKDLLQAAASLDYLKSMRAWDVAEAWADLIGRGRGWTTRARQGIDAMSKTVPELGVKRAIDYCLETTAEGARPMTRGEPL